MWNDGSPEIIMSIELFSIIVYWFCCGWRTTSPSRDCWAFEIAKGPTSLSSKTPEPSDINLSNASSNYSKSQDQLSLPSPPPSSHSTPSIVFLSTRSRMGWSNAFPSNRTQQILGLCWRHHFSPRTSSITQFFYSYNYNTFTTNIRYRTFRSVFPFLVAFVFADAYASYRKQILKINLFDEYCYLRSQELVKQNEYLLDHPGT